MPQAKPHMSLHTIIVYRLPFIYIVYRRKIAKTKDTTVAQLKSFFSSDHLRAIFIDSS